MLAPERHSVPKDDTCYWCGALADSDEHVPPKGLFPELKDIPEEDLRNNLLTVRSCPEHNQKKCHDDDYLMAVITPIIGNNSIAIQQTDTKLRRALERRGGSLEKAAYVGLEEFNMQVEGKNRVCAKGFVDNKRFFRAIEPVARGIYRLHYNKRFVGKCLLFADFLEESEEFRAEFAHREVFTTIDKDLPSWPSYATNPKVFYFQVCPSMKFGFQIIAFTFFEGAKVLVGFPTRPNS